MKKVISAVSVILFSAFLCLQSCGNSESKQETAKGAAAAATVTSNTAKTLPNYRYVDLDTLLSKYNLAKDYNEEMMRMQANMESEAKRHENSLQSLATTIQNKMQNNSYLSEASYKADEEQFTNAQANAQKAIANLQQNYAAAAEKGQKNVNDSIEAFIKDYNKKKGYDAIFIKNATLYINPDLDITSEVVEGLNARYNKVK